MEALAGGAQASEIAEKLLGVANNLQFRLQIAPAKRRNRTSVDWRRG
jgi:hypothetical protein